MKFFFFHLMPYGALDLDFDKKHEAAYLRPVTLDSLRLFCEAT